jgi:heterodisulfide reductase subunit C
VTEIWGGSDHGLSEADKGRSSVRIYVMGREYEVPSNLTIMKAMEYIGYRFIRGAGCREGFCGACATVYRIQGEYRLRMALACQETVQDAMYLAQIPFTPANKAIYDLVELRPTGNVLFELYPELARCLCCNTCTKACPQELEVMNYTQAAVKGDLEEIARLSFDCVSCGLCAMRCPAEIVPYNVALLARRLYGKYVVPRSEEIDRMVKSVEKFTFEDELNKLAKMTLKELKKAYEEREVRTV